MPGLWLARLTGADLLACTTACHEPCHVLLEACTSAHWPPTPCRCSGRRRLELLANGLVAWHLNVTWQGQSLEVRHEGSTSAGGCCRLDARCAPLAAITVLGWYCAPVCTAATCSLGPAAGVCEAIEET